MQFTVTKTTHKTSFLPKCSRVVTPPLADAKEAIIAIRRLHRGEVKCSSNRNKVVTPVTDWLFNIHETKDLESKIIVTYQITKLK